jgi:nucleoside-diphosphate-sugar epimerase
MSAFILVTGASGIAGLETTNALLAAGFRVRMADVTRPAYIPEGAEFTRCDTRTPGDCLDAVADMDRDPGVGVAGGHLGEEALRDVDNHAAHEGQGGGGWVGG